MYLCLVYFCDCPCLLFRGRSETFLSCTLDFLCHLCVLCIQSLCVTASPKWLDCCHVFLCLSVFHTGAQTLPGSHMCAHTICISTQNHSVFTFTVCLSARRGILCLINFKYWLCVCVCVHARMRECVSAHFLGPMCVLNLDGDIYICIHNFPA